MTIVKVKLGMPAMLGETVRVTLACTLFPALTTVFSWFHVTVMYVEALVGLQVLVVMLRVIGVVPSFLMYIVLTVDEPGSNVPQANEESGRVQPLSW